LLSALANDPDNLDYVYSTGDTVSLYFSRPTDRGGGPKSGDKAFVDGLVSFSQPLAYDYSGEWTSGSADGLLDADLVFRITILQATCPGCTPMPDPVSGATVKPKDAAAIRTRSSSSPRAFAPSPPLAGDYGKTRGPMIVSFAADDFDNGDAVYGGGDTLTVTFNGRTNRGAHSGGRDFVDSLFLMKPTVGPDYSGEWYDGSVFIIDVLQASRALSDYSGQYASSDCLPDDLPDDLPDGLLDDLLLLP
jgi:hypothetical protein